MAAALGTRGWSTTIPDLRSALQSPVQFCTRAIDESGPVDVVIGHSGAGVFLPIVADRTGATASIFIDAVVPDTDSEFQPSARFTEFLDGIPTADGLLAPWHEWWPTDSMSQLVPDESARRRIEAEIPSVPRSFYDEAVALPASWWTRPAAYLQLSPAYDDDRSRADKWGWPTHQLAGSHLDLVVHPDLVAEHVTELAALIR